MKLEEFKKKNKPKRMSKLLPFKSEILDLHVSNYSLAAIQMFLKGNGVNTTQPNLLKFIRKHLKDNVNVGKKNEMEKKDEENQKTKESWEPQLKIEGNPIMNALIKTNKENSDD